MNKNIKLIGLLAVLLLVLSACTTSATPASCAFIVGDGRPGTDANLHKIVYPGQAVLYDNGDENVTYVPCNSRNFIVNDGSVKSATGEIVGDRNTLIVAYTSSGIPIEVGISSYWTLNQSDAALRNFYEVCLKHSCASTSDLNSANAGGELINNSTPGWNDLLAEDFAPALERAVRSAASNASDTIWENHDQDEYEKMATTISEEFAGILRATLGYPEDLFCGSGNSNWTDPDKPGEGTFTCTPVRFVVDVVNRAPVEASDNASGVQRINEERLENARALYGDAAEYWLGLQDTILICQRESGTTCIINIGDGPVAIPSSSPELPADSTP